MFSHFTFLLPLLTAFFQIWALSVSVSAQPSSLENLAPREPTKVIDLEVRRGDDNRWGGSRPSPSISPSDGKKCIKIVKRIGGTTLTVGYLSEDYTERNSGIFKVTSAKRDCLKVIVPSGNGPFDLEIKGANGPKKYLGLAGSDNNKASYACKSAKTNLDSRPINVGNSAEASGFPLSETTVWSVNNGKLTAIWWPSSGNRVDVKTMMWPSHLDYVYFVTKPGEFKSTARTAFDVELYLTSPY